MSIPEIAEVLRRLQKAAAERSGLDESLAELADAAMAELERPPSRAEVAALSAAISNSDRACRRIEENFDGAGRYVGPPKHDLN